MMSDRITPEQLKALKELSLKGKDPNKKVITIKGKKYLAHILT